MRKWTMVASSSLMLAACSGGSSGGSNVQVVAAAPAATPTPTPTPAPTPTPTPTPALTSSSYQRYADLSGDRTFQTACASLLLGTGLPTPRPALSFGEALTLGYTAATGDWVIGGDEGNVSFAASEAVSVPAGQKSYQRIAGGVTQSFTITDPVVTGTTFDYTRSFALRAERMAGPTLYSCAFGVPALAADVPTAAVGYDKVSVSGTAYVVDQGGTVQTYVLSGSTGTVAYDPATNAMVVKVRLLGNLQTANGVAAAITELGTFSGNGAVEAARARFAGQLDSSDRISLFSSFSGAFFGNSETGAAFEVLATDTDAGTRVAAVGTVAASR